MQKNHPDYENIIDSINLLVLSEDSSIYYNFVSQSILPNTKTLVTKKNFLSNSYLFQYFGKYPFQNLIELEF